MRWWWQRAHARNVGLETLYAGCLIYVINSVDKAKLSCHTSPPAQHHSFFWNIPLYKFVVYEKVLLAYGPWLWTVTFNSSDFTDII